MRVVPRFFSLLIVLFLFCALSLPAASAQTDVQTDALYVNGNIYTLDKDFSRVSVLAVREGKILYAGDSAEEAGRILGAQVRVTDLGGKTVLPGLIEGHMHFLRYGERRSMIDIFWKPKAEILAKVEAEAKGLKPGEWLLSRGWNHEVWEGRQWPSKEDLDAVAPNNPVVLTRADNHSIWANSQALRAAGITRDTPDPQGGEILKNAQGEPSGILTDTAMPLVLSKAPPFSAERRHAAYLKAQEDLLRHGITSIVDAGESLENINILKQAYASGDMKLRAYVMLAAVTGQDKLYLQGGGKPSSGLFAGRLDLCAVKVVSDGSLGSRSAWLLEDYCDRPGHKGNGRYSDAELYAILKRARDNGFQVGVHAIGDGAVRQVIDQVEKVLNESPLKDHRYRIEHFQVVEAGDIPRALRLGLIPAMQAVHATSDMNMAEDRVGPERIKSSYAWRSVLNCEGGIIANGSDAPVEPVNPWHGIYASVTRMDLKGNPLGGWRPEQKMTRAEAVKSFTIWPAFAMFAEGSRGSLERGKAADFVVIDRDIMSCPESEIKDVEVLRTVLAGETVYAKD